MTLRVVFVLGLILTLSGCRAFSNKSVDVTTDPNWWGELKKGSLRTNTRFLEPVR